MARPIKFDSSKARTALLLARAGETQREVARGAGVAPRTLQYWLTRGRSGDPVFAEWAAEYDRLVNIIHRAKLQIMREKNMVESKARFQSFKRSREAWWLKRLGPVEFYARRLDWLY
jgi:transposase-like protein